MKNLCVFDLETTSSDQRSARICEISIKKLNQSLEIIDTYHSFINPTVTVDPEAVKVHGLTDVFLSSKPLFSDLAAFIINFIKGCDICGYNVLKFDIPILQREIDNTIVDFSILLECDIVDSYILYQNDNPRKLSNAYYFYTGKCIDESKAHQASNDVDFTIEVLKGQHEIRQHNLKNCIDETYNGKKPIDLYNRFYEDENGEIYFSFGKYKDKPLKSASLDYLLWVINLKDFEKSSKFFINQEIDKRRNKR